MGSWRVHPRAQNVDAMQAAIVTIRATGFMGLVPLGQM
jgi:hypothetical protein